MPIILVAIGEHTYLLIALKRLFIQDLYLAYAHFLGFNQQRFPVKTLLIS